MLFMFKCPFSGKIFQQYRNFRFRCQQGYFMEKSYKTNCYVDGTIFLYHAASFVRRTGSGNGHHRDRWQRSFATPERSSSVCGRGRGDEEPERTNGEDDATWLCTRLKQSL